MQREKHQKHREEWKGTAHLANCEERGVVYEQKHGLQTCKIKLEM